MKPKFILWFNDRESVVCKAEDEEETLKTFFSNPADPKDVKGYERRVFCSSPVVIVDGDQWMKPHVTNKID